MSVLLVPLSALCVALAVPAMSVLAFGQASGSQSVDLLAAALASLGVGLLPYGMFFLLARAFYVLGDSRVPALWGAVASLVGVVIMLVAGATTSSTTTVLALGLAHSVSFLIGCVALVVALHRRVGGWVVPGALPGCALVAAVAGVVVWASYQWWSPPGRGAWTRWRWSCSYRSLAPSTWAAPRLLGISVASTTAPRRNGRGWRPGRSRCMRTRLGAALLVVVGLLTLAVGPGSAADAGGRVRGPAARHRRAGAGVHGADAVVGRPGPGRRAAPGAAVGATSAVGDLSVRSVSRRTTAADGYATLNAGTRAEGTQQASLAFVAGLTRGTDGDPTDLPSEAFDPEPANEDVDAGPVPAPAPDPADPAALVPEAGENYDGSPAAEEFARRTGVLPQVGEVFNFGLVSMRDQNSKLLFDAEIGALGDALDDHGVRRAVIANGDHGEGDDDVDFRREASVGLMDGNGLVANGRVGRTLLETDSRAPFGTRLDNDEVAKAFGEFWDPTRWCWSRRPTWSATRTRSR